MALVFTSLLMNAAEHIFLCLLVSHMSSVGFGFFFIFIQVHGPFCKIPYEF